jgi:hypothetical protein
MITTGNGPTRSTEQTSIAFALQSAQGMDKFVRTWASPYDNVAVGEMSRRRNVSGQ